MKNNQKNFEKQHLDSFDSDTSCRQLLHEINTPQLQKSIFNFDQKPFQNPEPNFNQMFPTKSQASYLNTSQQELEEQEQDETQNKLIAILQKINYPIIFPEYSEKKYWNRRYSDLKNIHFEWIVNFDQISQSLLQILRLKTQKAQILYLGCGNSDLAIKLYNAGYKFITQIDFSEVAVKRMQEQCLLYKEMSVQEMDATALQFSDEQFDVIIEKATLDAVLTGKQCVDHAFDMIYEVYRCLKPGGYFVSVSHGDSNNRRNYFDQEQYKWSLKIVRIPKQKIQELKEVDKVDYHFVYICNKGDQAVYN